MYSQVKTPLSILWHPEPPSFSVAMETFFPLSIFIVVAYLPEVELLGWAPWWGCGWKEEQENNNDENHLEP